MPITGNASYLPTIDAFDAHWTAANAALPPLQPIITAQNVALAGLLTLRSDLVNQNTAITGLINDVEEARSVQNGFRARNIAIVNAFNKSVRAFLPGNPVVAALPAVPSLTDAPHVHDTAMRDMADLWTKVDALDAGPGFTPPLVLQLPNETDPEGAAVAFDYEDMEAFVEALPEAVRAVNKAEQDLTLARDQRDKIQRQVYQVLVNYRLQVPARFATGNPLIDSLPRLKPLPGKTPAAVAASGSWDAVAVQGKITWAASTEPDLDRYEIRYCPGSTYNTEDEESVATVDKDAPRELLTLTGLTGPGTTALFRVYVVLDTDNEKGSNTVSITRPE